MRKLILLLVLLFPLTIAVPNLSSALIINFDNLSTPNNDGGQKWGTIPVSYSGFTWTGDWEVAENSTFKSVYNNTGDFPSSPNAAYNDNGGATMSISFGSLYNVDSAYFRSFSQNNAIQKFSSTSVLLSGYRETTLVDSVSISLSPTGMVLTPLNFSSIDRLDFTTTSGTWWLVDNLKVNAVPLPGAVLLLGAGLARLAAYARRRAA